MLRAVRILALALAFAALATPEGGVRAMQDNIGQCPDDAIALRGESREYRCRCTAEAAESGPIWGTGVYTDDSRICAAARHHGAIGPVGGRIIFETMPGRESYEGSDSNGVVSADYGQWSGSFRIVAGWPPGEGSEFSFGLCPANASSVAQATEWFICDCTVGRIRSGAVWGSGPFTDDSSICRAARHLGMTPERGILVMVEMLPGQSSYEGSTQNGVTTRDYGAWDRSFMIRRPPVP